MPSYIVCVRALSFAHQVLLGMPVAHRDVVVVLLVFFKLVAQFSHVNKMTPLNIAVCFAPSIFKPPAEDHRVVSQQRMTELPSSSTRTHARHTGVRL